MGKELHLVGTMHLDPKGPERLRNALEIIKPKLVTIELEKIFFNKNKVEGSNAEIKNTLYQARRILEFDNLSFEKMLKATDSYLFEISACLDLAKEIPVIPIDLDLK